MKLNDAMQRIIEEMKSDEEFYNAWQVAISEAFKRTYNSRAINEPDGFIYCPSSQDIREVADDAADEFLAGLINFQL